MYCVKMQTSGNSAIVLDPSTSHLADALMFKASAVHAHVLVTAGDSSGSEDKAEVKGSKSSWFQRLKPRDDMENSRGAVTEEALETLKPERGRALERLEVGVRNMQPDRASQIIGRRPRPNWQADSSSAAKRQNNFDSDKDFSEAERQRSEVVQEKALKSESGKGIAVSAAALPTNVGFGPWVNFNLGRRAPKNVVHAAEAGEEVFKDAQGILHSVFNGMPKCGLGVSQGEANMPPTLCKPSVPPVHSKHGLPPRPPSQKLSAFHSPSKPAALVNGIGRGAFHQVANEHQPSEHILTTSATQALSMQDKEGEKRSEAALARIGSSSQKMKSFDGSIVEPTWNSKVVPTCTERFSPTSPMAIDNGSISSKEQPRAVLNESGNSTLLSGQHVGSCSDVATDSVREPVCTNRLSTAPLVDLQPKQVESGAEIFKVSLKNGSTLQAVSLEDTKSSTLQQSRTGSPRYGTRMLHEHLADASNSAALPWELFIAPAGASNKAREQFVQVYNRARDELKNQRLSQNMSRASSRELDGSSNLSLGPSGAASDTMIQRQSMKHGQPALEHMQFQGRNGKLEHQTFFHLSNTKEQNDAMAAAESTKGKQVESFPVLQSLPEGQLNLSHKTAVQEGVVEISNQRTGERSLIQGKELSLRDKEGQIFSSNHARNRKDLVKKVDNNVKFVSLSQGSTACRDKCNGQEAIPVLGKRPRVTSEDHANSHLAEKGVTSKARPQNRPNPWLQRWHSTSNYSSKGVSVDDQVGPDVKRSDTQSYHTMGLKKFGDGDDIGFFGRASVPSERVKSLTTSSSNVLPSAAAMAIVGTAARQFCSSQPQSKRSFAFWSGFGMPTHRKVDPVQEKGKEKVFSKPNSNLPSS